MTQRKPDDRMRPADAKTELSALQDRLAQAEKEARAQAVAAAREVRERRPPR